MKILFFAMLLLPMLLFSQQYRNINAYMDDFDRNETYLKKTLNDYSATLVNNHLGIRSLITSERIIAKLKSINTVLLRTDKGYEKNTLLRDSFVIMNQKTIEYLTNGSLILNDYELQCKQSIDEIRNNIRKKEKDINDYYEEIKKYEKVKVEFATTYKLPTKKISEINIFEYNAHQNLLFYKINVLDQKLITLINAKDKDGFNQTITDLKQIHQEVIEKSSYLKTLYKDESVNNANILYADMILNQYAPISILFNGYIDGMNLIEKIKNVSGLKTEESVKDYNVAVELYNDKKNRFFDYMDNIQRIKKIKNENWYVVNSEFLKHNIDFGNIYEKYTDND